jgi:glycosyltransferase involved in cell wall biosynthesis
MYQWGLARYIRRERPDAIIHWVNPRYLSFWTTLMWGRLLGIPVYGHGHGVYKKQRISWAYRQMMRLLLKLVASYICYAPFVRESFVRQGFDGRKLSVADNSAINTCPVRPEEKTGTERGVLFMGRLRAGCNVSLLIRAIERIRNTDGVPVTLQVIGTGDEQEALRTEAAARPWVTLHGELYDAGRIREISRDCAVGCYPGNAGLSVVHLMSLSLPVITHDDLPGHSGPEPSFVRNGVSGVLYDHRRPEEALYNALRGLIGDPAALHRMRSAAFLDYEELVHPTLASRLWAILGR